MPLRVQVRDKARVGVGLRVRRWLQPSVKVRIGRYGSNPVLGLAPGLGMTLGTLWSCPQVLFSLLSLPLGLFCLLSLPLGLFCLLSLPLGLFSLLSLLPLGLFSRA